LPQADDEPRCGWSNFTGIRDPALGTALSQGLQLDKTAQGDDMKPKPGTMAPAR